MRSLTPNLEALVNWTRDQGEKEDGLEREARREFRALKAVVRAAEHLVNEDRNRAPGTIHRSWLEAVGKTQRALSRLSREQSKKGGAKP